jgi:hypothetical protein
VRKPTYRSPADLADEMMRKHASSCEDCDLYDEIICRYHQGYREGVTTLLLRASVG